ncbi:alpha-N-arabinofuranosidase [Saccharopolyspora rhizosphaerae]|uniref:Alpha-N-arabinofuranosidase n=2 Tax=Saccharopolyspora rhizosphaerae TaxID=2492662 RepID=A0A3R8Q9J7_9PSEU|nr:alpha-N-arabinofuranosidase [Saccharopolyspora rhizosphaerae]
MTHTTTARAAPARFRNPLALRRADPHVHRHTDGTYFFTATVPTYDRVVLRRSTTLQGLGDAEEHVLWRRHDSGEMSKHVWAPELHHVDGRWYVYFAAGSAEDIQTIRMYVLENAHPDPLAGTWVERGRVSTPWDTFSLDATTFAHRGVRYLAWAQREPGIETNSNLYLAPMVDPWTLADEPVRLSVPTHDWEVRGYRVNEGPAALVRHGQVFLTFSASATDSNYCLGLLTAPANADLLDRRSWRKTPEPVFTTNPATGQYGPGHNSFTTAEDGTDVLVYHARPYDAEVGDVNRHARVQTFGWNHDGTPDFGVPVPD